MGMVKLVVMMMVVIAVLNPAQAQPEAKFNCTTTNATCRAVIDYTNPNGTTLSYIQTLFNVKQLIDILGANNLPSNTTGNYSVGPNKAIKVPFPCKCNNGTGLSDQVPVYTIKTGDTLYDIATTVFAGLVKYPKIQEVNNISDGNTIHVGDKLWIPLPCSCDEVGGVSVVHYGHLVELGNSIEGIAEEYGTTQQILLTLNGITDPKTLQAGQLLHVPLKACSSNVRNDSLDYPLLVANASYIYTAHNCIKCMCDSTNNFKLECEESSELKPTNWSICPTTQCSSNVYIGNITATDSCNQTTCDYAGYTSNNISTVLATHNTCAAAPNGSGPSSGATRSTLQGWFWSNLFIVIHLIFFSIYLVW
ncbi:putative LysM domain-containing protein [Lupinus albus]|uniref:Putative LysM domain-containing protein n=1 Tax=Lupinus albus TaxID=3870 RepID=A0A6A4PPX4_LUPAL|nr:putative LysM domain-containing protein [Lupinus albus]